MARCNGIDLGGDNVECVDSDLRTASDDQATVIQRHLNERGGERADVVDGGAIEYEISVAHGTTNTAQVRITRTGEINRAAKSQTSRSGLDVTDSRATVALEHEVGGRRAARIVHLQTEAQNGVCRERDFVLGSSCRVYLKKLPIFEKQRELHTCHSFLSDATNQPTNQSNNRT